MDEDEQLRLALAISQSDFGPPRSPINNNDPELEAAIQASIQSSRNNLPIPVITRQTTNEDENYQGYLYEIKTVLVLSIMKSIRILLFIFKLQSKLHYKRIMSLTLLLALRRMNTMLL